MTEFPPLDTFGRRIMICGPSSSGKSTLTAALGKKLGTPPVHLDQLSHLPGTDWQPRPKEEFDALHAEAILGEDWAMDGNYSSLMPSRAARATGIILICDNRWANLARYVRRCLFERNRPGGLEGGLDSVKWDMVHWILVTSPANLKRYRIELPQTGLPFLEIHGHPHLNRLYRAWNLTR
jgi:adenylate kinase family enzyme